MINNYTEETKSYLKKIGRSDVIDEVIPKTAQDLILEKKSQSDLIRDLVFNMSIVMNEVQELRQKVEILQNKTSHL